MKRKVWVVCRTTEASFDAASLDLLRIARELETGSPCAFSIALFGEKVLSVPTGFEDVMYFASPSDAAADALSRHFAAHVQREKPDVVLARADKWGRCLMAVAAALLETGLTADCTQLALDEAGNLLQTRPAFGGTLLAQIITPKARPQMATVRCSDTQASPGVMATPAFVTVDCRGSVTGARLICRRLQETLLEGNLSQSRIVIAGGIGVGSREGFDELRKLAQVLGAGVAASRAAVNAGFAPYACQIGQSGKTIAPDVYIAVGISGAVQHLAGIHRAGKIIAVNEDAKAPIFSHADVAVICDWKEYAGQLFRAVAG